MKIRVKVKEDNYFLKLIFILNNIPPFNQLRPKELELYAHLLTVNHRLRSIPFKERNRLIFTNENKIEIASLMGINITGVYNILSTFRSLKIIEKNSLLPKYTLAKTTELTFIFEDEDHI